MDRQKKPLYHNMTGRECGGERWLAGLPWVGAEVSKGYFSGQGFSLRSVGSKHQAGLPSLQNQARKGTQITSSCEKQQAFCLPGRNGWICREPLKGPTHTFCLQPLTLGSSKGGKSGLEMHE